MDRKLKPTFANTLSLAEHRLATLVAKRSKIHAAPVLI